ncbi:MAG: hypothetical protein HY738_06355, partial [Bacteroidia bacterium]|nr:hypothetical protein [Bacteroidia bacterium]
MKRVTIITLSLVLMVCTLYAQQNTAGQAQYKPMNFTKSDISVAPVNITKSYKAIGDTIWYDDFSNPANWAFSSGPTATGGSWELGIDAGSLDQYTSYGGSNPFNPPTQANGGAFINAIQYLLAPPIP